MARTTSSIGDFGTPTWTPDGRFVIAGGRTGLAWMPAKGGSPRTLLTTGNVTAPWSLTPDGRRLAYSLMDSVTAFDLWTVPIEESGDDLRVGKPEPYLKSRDFETYPSFSPDGRWIAYASNESGAWELYVRAFPDNATKVQVSRGGGRMSRWSKTGHELFFGTDDQRIMVATYSTLGGKFTARPPRQWTPTRLADTGVLPNFDVEPDGRHIVALLPARHVVGHESANQVTLIMNFFDEVRPRVQ